MKASELVSELVQMISKYGDLDILLRDCDNGYDYSGVSVHADPASEEEERLGVFGTIDLNMWNDSSIKFGEEYRLRTVRTIYQRFHGHVCTVLRTMTGVHEGMYLCKLMDGTMITVFEEELVPFGDIEW